MEELPLGIRFHPTDVQLLKLFLKKKVQGKKLSLEAIADLDVYKHAPWDLPRMANLDPGNLRWYFFCPMVKKYARGNQLNRASDFGCWKATGKDKPIMSRGKKLGMMKTLVFYGVKAPQGVGRDWVIREYRLDEEDKKLVEEGGIVQDYVLCVVCKKESPGDYQFAAPFIHDDEIDQVKNLVWSGTDSGSGSGSSSGSGSNPASNLSSGLASMDDMVIPESMESMEAPQVADQVPIQVQSNPIDNSLKSLSEIFGRDDEAIINNGNQGNCNFGLEQEAPQVAEEDYILSSLLAPYQVDFRNNALESDFLEQEVTRSSPPLGFWPPQTKYNSDNSWESQALRYGQGNHGGSSSNFIQGNGPSNY
ncbi:No apical meristem (NAM) protein [Corchorus capsularis]|uniref:No apical meristem (NAM) protein n=1 Tax=Corchorus capsularis TaxID=210143 RepID=A0A1R3GUE5_COCAP|nr:No apical meristem (NAM) protein [Corchorus capsularis]